MLTLSCLEYSFYAFHTLMQIIILSSSLLLSAYYMIDLSCIVFGLIWCAINKSLTSFFFTIFHKFKHLLLMVANRPLIPFSIASILALLNLSAINSLPSNLTVNVTDMIRVLYPISVIITLTFLYSFSICH